MKSTFAIAAALFAAAISAAPTERRADSPFPPVTVQLTNDLTGRSGSVTIPSDGVSRPIESLFGNSPIAVDGKVLASSAQLTNFPQGVFCIIAKGETPVGIFNFKKTFADLDGNPAKAEPVDLTGTILNCQV